AAIPHPPDERVEGDAHLRRVLSGHPGQHHVHILPESAHDAHFRGWLERWNTAAVYVFPLLRLDHTHALPVAERLAQNGRGMPVQLIVARHTLTHEAPLVTVRIHGRVLRASPEGDVELLLERRPRERREEHDD